MKRQIKNILAMTAMTMMVAGSVQHVFASPIIYNKPPAPSTPSAPTTDGKQKEQSNKKLLSINEAIKSAVSNNLNLKKNELTRESLLKEIDNNYSRDMSIFTTREWEEKRLKLLLTALLIASLTHQRAFCQVPFYVYGRFFEN